MQLLLACFVILGALLLPVSAAFTSSEETAILNAHNNRRAAINKGLSDLTWNADLASVAQAYSEGCKFAHNANRNAEAKDAGYSGTSVGENLYLTTGSLSATAAVTAWYNEKKDYDDSTYTCASGKVCGHYTQVEWSTTTEVGCGSSYCSPFSSPYTAYSGYIVVCNYGPAGNWVGETPYQNQQLEELLEMLMQEYKNPPDVEILGDALVQEKENDVSEVAEKRLKALLQKIYKD